MTQAESTDASTDGAGQWRRQFGVTLILLVVFVALAAVMISLAHGDDVVWQRRVYVFGAVEAIVFTAVGWLFGREVNRSAVTTARADAEAARSEAAQARAETRDETARASRAGSTLEAVRAATRAAARTPATGDPSGISDRGPDRHDQSAVDLRILLQELLDPPRGR